MEFFGLKTIAWFDIWSIEHFLSGVSILTFSKFISHKMVLTNKDISLENINFKFYLSYIFCISYIWESIEFYLEAGYTNNEAITFWFQGVEFWGNRLITDPMLTVLGAVIGLRYHKILWPARILCLLWLMIHVFYFPHSMYLHELWDR